MESQKFTLASRVRSHAGEFNDVLHVRSLGGFDECALPFNKALRNRRQQEHLFHTLQSNIECLRLIEVACRQLDIRPLEMGGFAGIAYEGAHMLSLSRQLPDKFLSVVSSCSSDQDHR